MSVLSLSGKLALVTGAASGIGFAVAKSFAEQDADLVLIDVSPSVMEQATLIRNLNAWSGRKNAITAHVLDITNKAEVDRVFQEIKIEHSKHRAVNIVVNSAGVAQWKSFIEITEEEFDQMICTNLKGTFLITQAAVRELVTAFPDTKFTTPTESYASIINFSSQAGR